MKEYNLSRLAGVGVSAVGGGAQAVQTDKTVYISLNDVKVKEYFFFVLKDR